MVKPIVNVADADRNLFTSSYTLRALRDSRYHNSAYAIAELLDNSIEAYAEKVELLCKEQTQRIKARMRRRVSEIAVLDNGSGMDFVTLIEALRFGGGTRHRSIKGIGKYGMGLPTSSMSQCKRVDVWTWQGTPESMWHSYIDADNIETGQDTMPLVPKPDQETPIPESWRIAGSDDIFDNNSGTLVVWSKLDKVQWKTGRAILENTAREVGRIHRHFIDADITRIRLASFHERRPSEFDFEQHVVANDPLYLMSPTSVPDGPWDKEPMFRQWGVTRYYSVDVEGKEETIEVKYSIVKPEALTTERPTQNPGGTDRGRHARHNIGVSVVREDREIVLEDAFLREGGSSENPQNRWWGCEVWFGRGCDDLFGVDHNKQMVAHFTQAAKTLARDDRPNQVILDELEIEDDIIHEIVGDIRDQARAMMREIKKMFQQRRRGAPDEDPASTNTPERKAVRTATDADRDAINAGEEVPTQTDKERASIPPDERESELARKLIEYGQAEEEAKSNARRLVQETLSYQFNPAQLDGYQMFNVRSTNGILFINLNMDHPVYDLLKHIEHDLDEHLDENDPVFQAGVAIRLLLLSWARMEDHTESREERMRIQSTAMNWGRQVDKVINFLRERDT
ncbi:MAG: hypothetical protein F4X19_07555 [Acidobacteria bacterium]|nr:hypothetical protein [Acidobacteriota bacterium]